MTNRPEDKNNDVFIIKAPKNASIDKALPNIKLLGKLISKEKPTGDDRKPLREVDKVKQEPGLETVDVGDDKVRCVKITGDQLSRYANPENRDAPADKVKDAIRDADEDDLGTKYFFRKIVGDGLDKPDETQLVEIPPNKKMDEIYDTIKATSGGITKPDEGVQLVKVIGDVEPKDINDHLKENKKVNDKPKKDKLPKTYDFETKPKGGKIKSVSVLSDPQNTTNKNLPVKSVFKKMDQDKKKKEPEFDNSAFYYTKTLGDLAKKDEVPKVTPIDPETEMKVLYNKLRGDMTNKPEDKNNDIFLIQAILNSSSKECKY